MRSRVLNGDNRVGENLALEGSTPKMSVGLFDVRIDGAQAHSRERFSCPAPSEGTGVVKGDRKTAYRNVAAGVDLNRRIVRRILDHVERHIAKVALIGHAITAAQTRLSV